VAELGPGDSLGVGLAALLCGADHLHSLDVVEYANISRNVEVLHQLRELFVARTSIPDDQEFPGVYPKLENYIFPNDLLDLQHLDSALDPGRMARIEEAIIGVPSDVSVEYHVPWDEFLGIGDGGIDLIFSQAVFEHIENLSSAYRALERWLAPDGCMCHTIDFRSHKITSTWDGHLQYPSWLWQVVKGRRPYLLNRESAQRHLDLLRQNGFQVVAVDRSLRESSLEISSLANEFSCWSEIDRRTAGAVILAQRNGRVQRF